MSSGIQGGTVKAGFSKGPVSHPERACLCMRMGYCASPGSSPSQPRPGPAQDRPPPCSLPTFSGRLMVSMVPWITSTTSDS